MSSTSSTGDEGLLSARSSIEPKQLGLQQTDDALSAAISLLDLRSTTPQPPVPAERAKETTPASAAATEDSETSTESEIVAALEMAPAELLVLVQEACLEHRYLRTKDISTIVERPERLRAVKIGIAAAFARLHPDHIGSPTHDADGELQKALEELDLSGSGPGERRTPPWRRLLKGVHLDVFRSRAHMRPDDSAFVFAHPNINQPPDGFEPLNPSGGLPVTPSATPPKGDPFSSAKPPPKTYAEQLIGLCQASSSAFGAGKSEVPSHLPQGDLYLSPGSESAILGALGTCCEAVDAILAPSSPNDRETRAKRAFVSVRPPGHHCAESEPMGFCWANNVAVAAAHAHLRHGVDRVVILDADLHHGNGTQDVVWKLNENAEREAAKAAAAAAAANGTPKKGGRSPAKSKVAAAENAGSALPAPKKRELRLFYGSLHDIFSYPCEDGDPDMVRDASVNLSGGHGQWIANVHLQSWTDEDDFFQRLYPKYRKGLLDAAEQFCVETTSTPGKTLVIISAGFDACEHESVGMSRHGRNVPASFYHRFSCDVANFADRFSQGKLLSVLEGGYSDRALTSATLAHLTGLAASTISGGRATADHVPWWELGHLTALEKACKAKAKKTAANGAEEAWLAAAVEHFRRLEPTAASSTTPTAHSATTTPAAPASGSMTLRARKPRVGDAGEASPSMAASKAKARAVSSRAVRSNQSTPRGKTPQPPGGLPIGALGGDTTSASSDEASSSRQTSMTPPLSDQSDLTAVSSDPGQAEVPGALPPEKKQPGIKFVWKAGGIGGAP